MHDLGPWGFNLGSIAVIAVEIGIGMDRLVDLCFLPFVLTFGSAVGSFLNVVVYRLPAGLSVIHPPSRCPSCLHPLGKTENIPVLGWLWLRGRCRWCKTSISARYPLVEAVTGLLFVGIFWQFGWTIFTPSYWIFVSFLIALTLIDWDTMTLPGVLTQSGLLLGLAFQGVRGGVDDQIPQALMTGILGALVGLWCFDLIRLAGSFWLNTEAMGDGDPKLAAMLGAWLGWQLLLLAGFVACLIGSVVGGMAIAMGSLKQGQGFPFGPFLALGGLVSLIWGSSLLELYRQFFLPSF